MNTNSEFDPLTPHPDRERWLEERRETLRKELVHAFEGYHELLIERVTEIMAGTELRLEFRLRAVERKIAELDRTD